MSNNPILSVKRNLILYFVFWLIIGIINFGLLFIELKVNFNTAFIDSLVFSSILCGLGLSFWFPAKYIQFENNNFLIIVIDHVLGGIIASIIWLSSGYFIIVLILNNSTGYTSFFNDTIVWRFTAGNLFYYLITSFYYLIIYYNNFQEKIIQESELKNLITEAEIKTLKFQINPHFIFNSLNSISALTTINPVKAREMIHKLADFLRFTLANNDKQKNSFGEELSNIKLYLDIEKIRFEDKFEFIEEIDDCCINVQIPNMILQPIFENVLKHAVYETLSTVILKITCLKEDNYLKISIENNFDSSLALRKGTGIGLQNIEKRLKLIYGLDNLLKIEKFNNLFLVTLLIPINNI